MNTMTTAIDDPSLASADNPIEFMSSGTVRHDFMASLLPGVFEQKVLNLVLANGGRLRAATPHSVTLRIGKRNWLRWLSKQKADFPVDVTLTLHPDTPCAKSMTHVVTEMRPRSRASKDLVGRRCIQLVRSIHSCFIGHQLERLDNLN